MPVVDLFGYGRDGDDAYWLRLACLAFNPSVTFSFSQVGTLVYNEELFYKNKLHYIYKV